MFFSDASRSEIDQEFLEYFTNRVNEEDGFERDLLAMHTTLPLDTAENLTGYAPWFRYDLPVVVLGAEGDILIDAT